MPIALYAIAILATAGVILRPLKIPEAVFALGGAAVLLAFGLITPGAAWTGVKKGADVYLFLTGMMLLAETAREEKLFDWLAAHAARYARGSATKLFFLIYGVGTVVTIFLSNDATAVVLTPAVAAVATAARLKNPLPYLFICAFVANSASFLLPIANPANLVMYGSQMPPLAHWLSLYLAPSLVSITITALILYGTQRKSMRQPMEADITAPPLTAGGRVALWGIFATALILLVVSSLDEQLGLPTAITGILTTAVVLIRGRRSPIKIIRGISWSVLLLVAGLFIIVEALDRVGFIAGLGHGLGSAAGRRPAAAFCGSGMGIALITNLANNLPVGLVAAGAVKVANIPEVIRSGILIGVDLGPNLSVTGSLATILWLTALRREGLSVSGWKFLKLGVLVMIPTLALSLMALWFLS